MRHLLFIFVVSVMYYYGTSWKDGVKFYTKTSSKVTLVYTLLVSSITNINRFGKSVRAT